MVLMAALGDFGDDFKAAYLAMCNRLQTRPLDLGGVAANESGLYAGDPDSARDRLAHNPDGHASGLWQVMPDIARGLGWDPADCAGADGHTPLWRFRRLTPTQQLPWFERYFSPYKGKLVSRAACYVATFMPADLGLAADPNAVLVDKSEADPKQWRRGWAYSSNAGFDENHDLKIQVCELEDAIRRAARGPRWQAFTSMLGEAPSTIQSDAYDLGTVWGQEQALTELGYYAGGIDGVPGPLLKAAVVKWQADHSLEQVGYFGPRTRATVRQALVDKGLLPA